MVKVTVPQPAIKNLTGKKVEEGRYDTYSTEYRSMPEI
jgi:hypothetical protein